MIRDFRPSDTPTLVDFLTTQFPAEEAIIGSHPERFFEITRRVYRWDSRLILGLLRLLGKPVYRFLVVDEGGRAVATTILTFPGPAVYISMVATDPKVRRRGLATSLLRRTQEVAQRMGRQYLVLDVLSDNAPARALYEGRLGYGALREAAYLVHDRPSDFAGGSAALPAGIRRYRRSDESALVTIARRQTPSEVERVLPRKVSGLAGSRIEARLFRTESVAWVVDRGQGPEAGMGVSWSPDVDAAHFADPIVSPTADPATVRELVRTAGAWCAARGALRIAGQVPVANGPGRSALEREGFHGALSLWTLYRTVR
jgi:ribosomal protein S18 acetylase RimI-like enzyme